MDGKFSQPIKCFQFKALSGDYNANMLFAEIQVKQRDTKGKANYPAHQIFTRLILYLAYF